MKKLYRLVQIRAIFNEYPDQYTASLNAPWLLAPLTDKAYESFEEAEEGLREHLDVDMKGRFERGTQFMVQAIYMQD